MPADADPIVCPFCGVAYDLGELRQLVAAGDTKALAGLLERTLQAPENAVPVARLERLRPPPAG